MSKNKIISLWKRYRLPLLSLILGLLIGGLMFSSNRGSETHDHETEQAEGTVWTCSMHPQIRQSEPGQCPICGMDLIPASEMEAGDDKSVIRLDDNARRLAGVRTTAVRSTNSGESISLDGEITANESATRSVSTHVEGRIERLLVNYEGQLVSAGQTVAYLYSPELETALDEIRKASEMKDDYPKLYRSAIRKLENYDLDSNTIVALLNRENGQALIPLKASYSGYVSALRSEEGDHLMKGQELMQLKNYSDLWVEFDLYENQLGKVHLGDTVGFHSPVIPGYHFTSVINYIDPDLQKGSRITIARANVKNVKGMLKPGLLVKGKIGTGMKGSALIIPASAVLWTGKRSVVYVEDPTEKGTYVYREVTLGEKTDHNYTVIEGLTEGEKVVVSGTFQLDAAAQLQDKNSMMNPPDSTPELSDPSEIERPNANAALMQFNTELLGLISGISESLAENNLDKAKENAFRVKSKLEKGKDVRIDPQNESFLRNRLEILKKQTAIIIQATNLKEARTAFLSLGNASISLGKAFGSEDVNYYLNFCPMANDDKGGWWVAGKPGIRNPYFGDTMHKCGITNDSTISQLNN